MHSQPYLKVNVRVVAAEPWVTQDKRDMWRPENMKLNSFVMVPGQEHVNGYSLMSHCPQQVSRSGLRCWLELGEIREPGLFPTAA